MAIDFEQRRANYILVTKDTSPEAREFMASTPECALEYAKDVLLGRFIEAEKIIANHASLSYYYAIILNARFLEGEKAISSNALYSCLYVRDIIKGRFPEAEKEIALIPICNSWYNRYISKGEDVISFFLEYRMMMEEK